MQQDLLQKLLKRGVSFESPDTTFIDESVSFSGEAYIESNVHILQGTKIGHKTIIKTGSYITQTIIGDNVTINPYSIIHNAVVHNNAQIGPFAHIRNNTIIGDSSCIGNFVEVNKSVIGKASKMKHLSYIGNAVIGDCVNVGAGAITCNYDGKTKHRTTVHDYAFIGSNSALIAPITIGESSLIAAGSTITEDVPAHSLAIARQRQTNKVRRIGLTSEKIKT